MIARPLLVLILLLATLAPVSAQLRGGAGEGLPGGTFITPFPAGDTYRIQVYGESTAEGLLGGLAEAMAKEARIAIQKRSRTLAGLLRGDGSDELRAIEGELEREAPHVAIVMPNMIQRFPWRENFDRRFPPGSEARREEIQRRREAWKAERGSRLDQLIKGFRRKGAAVYLVGQPIMRNQFTTDDAQVVNELMRERALMNGAKYIDIYGSFADETGSFDAQGPDIEGKQRILRDQEGIGFTAPGFRKLGHFVERELKRDLAQARAERSVPLAGSEEEQKRVRPALPASATAAKGGLPTLTKDGKPAQGVNRPGSPPQPQPGAWSTRTETVASGDDLKADNSRITLKTVNLQGREDSLTIEIVRPAIPASLVAAVTRRESVDKPSQVGDAVVTEIAGGQTMVSSVTPVGESAGGDRRRGNTGVNSPYHLVLEKGQRLPAKPGRSDDMPWPRQETLPNASADTGAPGALPEVRRPPAAKGGPTKAGQPRG